MARIVDASTFMFFFDEEYEKKVEWCPLKSPKRENHVRSWLRLQVKQVFSGLRLAEEGFGALCL